MNINAANYESWFLDYFEGELSTGQVAELFLFLEQHPDLNEEFKLLELTGWTKINKETASFPDKNRLKKSDEPSVSTIEEWLIAEMEGQLDAGALLRLETFLTLNPSYHHLRELFRKVKLQTDERVEFPFKSDLKKTSAPAAENIHEWLIAEMEGELNLQERQLLLTYLKQHPEFEHDRNLYNSTILKADQQEIFEGKKSLYRGAIQPLSGFARAMRIAAILLLLIGAAFVFRLSHTNNTTGPAYSSHVPRIKNGDIPSENETITNEHKDTGYQKNPPSVNEAPVKNEKASPYRSFSPKPTLADKEGVIHTGSEIRSKVNTYNKEMKFGRFASAQRDNDYKTSKAETTNETVTALQSRGCPLLPEQEPFVFAERRYTPKATVLYENPNEPPSLTEILKPGRIGEEVIDFAIHQVNKAAGEEVIVPSSKPARIPLGSRLIKVAARAIGKISNDKIKIRTAFNPVTGKLSAYEVETNKRILQKQF